MFINLSPTNWSKKYIENYWICFNNSNQILKIPIIPDGFSDIIFLNNKSEINMYIIGYCTKSFIAHIHPDEFYIGIRFKPGFINSFVNIPINEFVNSKISVPIPNDNVDIFLRTFRSSIKNYSLPAESLDCLLKYLFKVDTDSISRNISNYIIETKGMTPISNILNKYNISYKKLERTFNKTLGITPKLYSRIIRFNYAYNNINNNSKINTVDLSLDAGFYDQSHYYKDHNEFTGLVNIKEYSLV